MVRVVPRLCAAAVLFALAATASGCIGRDSAVDNDPGIQGIDEIRDRLERAGLDCGESSVLGNADSIPVLWLPQDEYMSCERGESVVNVTWLTTSTAEMEIAAAEQMLACPPGEGAFASGANWMATSFVFDDEADENLVDVVADELGASPMEPTCSETSLLDELVESMGDLPGSFFDSLGIPSDEEFDELYEDVVSEPREELNLQFGEPLELDYGLVVYVSNPRVGGFVFPWLEIDIRIENRTAEMVWGPPSAGLVCSGSTEPGDVAYDSSYSNYLPIPSGSFREGSLLMYRPTNVGSDLYDKTCDAPAAVRIAEAEFNDVGHVFEYPLPLDLLAALNDR